METPQHNMIYRYLGPTGIKVSVLGFGNYANNDIITEEKQGLNDAFVKKCLENGLNYFDTAESYGAGAAETMIGNSFKNLAVKREDIVIATKVFFF